MGFWSKLRGLSSLPSKLYVFENGVLYGFNPNQKSLRKGGSPDDLAKDIARDGYGLSDKIKIENVSYDNMPRAVRGRLKECIGEIENVRGIHKTELPHLRRFLKDYLQKKQGKIIKVK